MKTFKLQIVSPDGIFFDGDAEQITLRTIEGEVSILAGHIPYLTALDVGECKVYTKKEEPPRRAACIGGFLSVSENFVRVAAVTFEWSEDIDVERAKSAKENAERIINTSAPNTHEAELAKIKLKRALARLKVAEK